MLLSFNKNFFALVIRDASLSFSFKLENFLMHACDVELEVASNNNLERNIEGELINLNPKEKFVFKLKGNGILNYIDIEGEFLFITSKLKKRYADEKRPIIFDYLFLGHDIPLEDKAPNLGEIMEPEDMFCIPIFQVMVVSKNIYYKNKNSFCELVLKEV